MQALRAHSPLRAADCPAVAEEAAAAAAVVEGVEAAEEAVAEAAERSVLASQLSQLI